MISIAMLFYRSLKGLVQQRSCKPLVPYIGTSVQC